MRNRIVVICFLFTIVGRAASAGDQFYINSRPEAKSPHRWSLAEWLDQRDHMRLMDLWLVLHSPSPFEFYLGGDYQAGRDPSYHYYGGWEGFVAAYASIFGLEARDEVTNLSRRTSGFLNLRVFGYRAQATNLTLQAGVKNEGRNGATYWNALAGATITLYINRFFGFETLYRHYFPNGNNGLNTSGDRYEAGVFIDFQFARIYADYFFEQETAAPLLSRSGGAVGTKLFF